MRVTLALNIKEGDVEGTDIGGRQVVIIADTPKVTTEGNWKLGVYVDGGARQEQFNKLVKVFGGERWALMASLFALGVMSVSWMAVVAGLIAVEKTLPWRRTTTYGTAAQLLWLGILVIAAPHALPMLTIPAAHMA